MPSPAPRGGRHSRPRLGPPRGQQGARFFVGPRRQFAVVSAVTLPRHQLVVDELAAQRGMVAKSVGRFEDRVDLFFGVAALGFKPRPHRPHGQGLHAVLHRPTYETT